VISALRRLAMSLVPTCFLGLSVLASLFMGGTYRGLAHFTLEVVPRSVSATMDSQGRVARKGRLCACLATMVTTWSVSDAFHNAGVQMARVMCLAVSVQIKPCVRHATWDTHATMDSAIHLAAVLMDRQAPPVSPSTRPGAFLATMGSAWKMGVVIPLNATCLIQKKQVPTTVSAICSMAWMAFYSGAGTRWWAVANL